MIKKLFSIFIIILTCFCFAGCDKNKKKPYLLFNALPISQKTIYDAQKIFKPGQTIHYVILMPKGFKQDYIKMQVVKRADNVPQGGISIYHAEKIFIDLDKKFYIDKFVIHNEGCYVVRFFYGYKPQEPFVENILWVKN